MNHRLQAILGLLCLHAEMEHFLWNKLSPSLNLRKTYSNEKQAIEQRACRRSISISIIISRSISELCILSLEFITVHSEKKLINSSVSKHWST